MKKRIEVGGENVDAKEAVIKAKETFVSQFGNVYNALNEQSKLEAR